LGAFRMPSEDVHVDTRNDNSSISPDEPNDLVEDLPDQTCVISSRSHNDDLAIRSIRRVDLGERDAMAVAQSIFEAQDRLPTILEGTRTWNAPDHAQHADENAFFHAI